MKSVEELDEAIQGFICGLRILGVSVNDEIAHMFVTLLRKIELEHSTLMAEKLPSKDQVNNILNAIFNNKVIEYFTIAHQSLDDFCAKYLQSVGLIEK